MLTKEIGGFKQFIDQDGTVDLMVSDNNNILYHVVFGSLSRYFIDSYKKDDTEKCIQIISTIELLCNQRDDIYGLKEEIRNIVGVSFLENLHLVGNKYDYEEIQKLLPEALRSDLNKIDQDYGNPYP